MQKTPFVLVLLLLVAGLGGYLCWSSADPELKPVAAGGADVEGAADVSVDGGTAALATGAVEVTEEVLPDDFLRDAVGADEGRSGRALVVQVWQGRKGVPAPLAEVFALAGTDDAKAVADDPYAQHISALAETRGTRFEADEAGRVELPPVQDWTILSARLPGAYGQAIVGRGHQGITMITLQPDETVTVRVVDGDGRVVAGAPVGVVQHVPQQESRAELFARLAGLEENLAKVRQWMDANPDQRELAAPKLQAMRQEHGALRREIGKADGGPPGDGRANDGGRAGGKAAAWAKKERARQQRVADRKFETRPELRARRRTDENGLAVFRHFQLYRNLGGMWWPPEHHDRFQASLLMPLQQPEVREFTGRPVPEEVIELRLPDCGSLALRTVDRDGRPFTHPVHANLRIEGEKNVPWSRVQVRKEQNEIAVVFPFVGLGMRFGANCRLDDNDFRWPMPAFSGPTKPGERVVVDLVVAPDEGMLFGRLFDAAGRPLHDEAITFLINGMAGRLEGEAVLLDHAGRFHLPYQMRPNHQPPFQLQIRRPGVARPAGLALPLASLPRAHVTDIGELALDSLGVVAQGLVHNDLGEPIVGAQVQLQRERNVGREQVRMKFVEEAFASVATDAEGRYALFGQLESARYRLRVDAKEHFHVETPDLRREGRANDVEMLRKSRLLGTVIRPEWLLAKGVRTELVPVMDPREKRQDQLHDYRGKSYAYFDWVRPGVYDLTMRVNQFPDPFLRIDRLVVEPGQMGVHPRLHDLDLGACLYRFELFAVDENGQGLQPKRPLIARVQRPDGSSSHIGLPWGKGGRIEMLSTSPQTDVIPMMQGYSSPPAMVAAGRNEVRFLAMPPVDVQLVGLAGQAGTINVQVVLEMLDLNGLPQRLDAFDEGSKRVAGWYARAKYSAAMLDARDTARLQLMRAGPHKVILRFGVKQGIRPTTVELPAVDIQLQPGSGPLHVAVAYDPQVTRSAIAAAAAAITTNAQTGK